MVTQQKITRPSDDPIIALRALRLRTNLSQVTQYADRNAKDAEAWMKITESAILVINDVLKSMYTECTHAVDSEVQTGDRAKILENLRQLRDEVYVTGNADYAGRTVFTGYRTNMELFFSADTARTYNITEQLTKNVLDTVKYIKTHDGTAGGDDLMNVTGSNYAGSGITENDIEAFNPLTY